MRPVMDRFRDRRDAGRRLAQALQAYRGSDVLVLGLPRGGVPVAFEVARSLRLPLDVLVVREVGAPDRPELALGAVAQGGVVVRNEDIVAGLGIDDTAFDRPVEEKRPEVEERVARFRGGRPLLEVRGRTVLLVDDGATGSTIVAGAQALRKMGPARIVMAVPVLPSHVLERLRQAADQVVTLLCRDDFLAVGPWYDVFSQATDDDMDLLAQAVKEAAA